MPMIWAILAKLTCLFMKESHSGQIPTRLPNFSVIGEYSAILPAGDFGRDSGRNKVLPVCKTACFLTGGPEETPVAHDRELTWGVYHRWW